MRILLTNDDGVRAHGLAELKSALASLGEVWVVAPEREQSATSHSLTLNDPLRVIQLEERVFSISGTPTDCVLLAVRGIRSVMEPHPDLVVAGINHGPNMGDDVTYSGTVAAAIEGRLLGLPAVAFSNAAWRPEHLAASAEVARRILPALVAHPEVLGETLLNVNIPDSPLEAIRGVRVTHLGKRIYRDEIIAKTDPRGRHYYWIGGDPPIWEHDAESDFGAVSEGYVSITPLRTDWTSHETLELLRVWESGLGALLPVTSCEHPA
jgi:5'-nucleotidase